MPYSIVHLKLAKKKQALEKNCKTEEEKLDFFAGNIFVDVSYNLKKNGIDISRKKTHYYNKQDYFKADFPKNFLKQESIENNFFNLGYYYHLEVDKLWRDIFLKQKITFEKIGKKDYGDTLYQIFRKYNAFLDYQKFIKNNEKTIEKLYNYKIKKEKLPKIFEKVPEKILQQSFIKMLDFMTFKETFEKKDELKYLKISEDKIFLDEKIKKDLEKFYPKKEYKIFYKKALEISIN